MQITHKKFGELNTQELYTILALRTEIFVVEQQCAYQELDFHDQKAHHIIAKSNGELIAYARILPAETAYEVPSIGRVLVKKDHRRKGFGHQIFDVALTKAIQLYPKETIKLQAQCYLEEFYKSFGFKTISEPYPDFGIMHVDMIYSS